MSPYACHGRPRPTPGSVTHYAQREWVGQQRLMGPVRFVFEPGCMYDKSHADARCVGCPHVKKE